ncbi:hypothetical protein Tco_0568142 [Tanacetum coccineum]
MRLYMCDFEEVDDDDSESKEELSKDDEADADHVTDEMVNMANTGDATLHVSTASSHFVSIVSATSSGGNIQALIAKAVWEKKNIPSVKIPNVQTLGAMRRLKEIQIIQVPGALPKFAKRVKKPLKTEVDDLVIKPMHKEFNDLNRLEIQRDIMVVNAQQLQIKTKYQLLPKLLLRGDESTQPKSDHVKENEPPAKAQGEQSSEKALPTSTALIVH